MTEKNILTSPETKCSFIREVILGLKVPYVASISNRLL